MRKLCALFIWLFVFALFCCTMPESIEVTGNPSLKFAANMDFSEIFSGMINEALKEGEGERTVLKCTNASFKQQTYIIHVNLFDEDLDITVEGDPPTVIVPGEDDRVNLVGPDENDKYTHAKDGDVKVTTSRERPIMLDLAEIQKTLQGFIIEETAIKTMLYISGGDIINECDIYLNLHETGGNIADESILITERTGNSGINLDDDEYPDISLPTGRVSDEFNKYISSLVNFEIHYEVYLRENAIFEIDWIRNPPAKIELVIMLELRFKAVADDGGEFKLDELNEVGDFLTSLPDLIKTVDVEIRMNENPFKEGAFVIRDISENKYDSIYNFMGDDTLGIVINEKQMADITGAENKFKPEICFFFNKGNLLYFNKDIKIMTVSLKANLYYEMEL